MRFYFDWLADFMKNQRSAEVSVKRRDDMDTTGDAAATAAAAAAAAAAWASRTCWGVVASVGGVAVTA